MAAAWARLGLAGPPRHDVDARSVRTAYRRHLRGTHPDLSPGPDATAATVELTAAYRVVRAYLDQCAEAPGSERGPSNASDTSVSPGAPEPDHAIGVSQIDADTIGIEAPPDQSVADLIGAAHRLGEIAYLDRHAGLLEVVIEFIDAPVCSVVLSTQGRAATGITEVFVTVEPLGMGEAPPVDAVTRLLVATLTAPPAERPV